MDRWYKSEDWGTMGPCPLELQRHRVLWRGICCHGNVILSNIKFDVELFRVAVLTITWSLVVFSACQLALWHHRVPWQGMGLASSERKLWLRRAKEKNFRDNFELPMSRDATRQISSRTDKVPAINRFFPTPNSKWPASCTLFYTPPRGFFVRLRTLNMRSEFRLFKWKLK